MSLIQYKLYDSDIICFNVSNDTIFSRTCLHGVKMPDYGETLA